MKLHDIISENITEHNLLWDNLAGDDEQVLIQLETINKRIFS